MGLMPIGVLSAYYNGSAIKIFSPVVVQTVRTHSDGWIRFYRWMAVWLAVLLVGMVLGLVPLLGPVVFALVLSVVVVLVGRTIGLLAQAFIINWVADEE